MNTFGEQKNCTLDRIKPYQRPKLSDRHPYPSVASTTNAQTTATHRETREGVPVRWSALVRPHSKSNHTNLLHCTSDIVSLQTRLCPDTRNTPDQGRLSSNSRRMLPTGSACEYPRSANVLARPRSHRRRTASHPQ